MVESIRDRYDLDYNKRGEVSRSYNQENNSW
jgi:hypothetical protein